MKMWRVISKCSACEEYSVSDEKLNEEEKDKLIQKIIKTGNVVTGVHECSFYETGLQLFVKCEKV